MSLLMAVSFPLPPAESPEHVPATLDSNCGTSVSAYVWFVPDITFGFQVSFSVVRLQYFLLKGFSLVTLPKSSVKETTDVWIVSPVLARALKLC